MPTAHHRKDCPGRCGRRIIHAMVACHWCWLKLPQHLRDAVTLAGPADRKPVTAVLAWYRAQTTQAAMGGSRGETL